MKQKPLIFNPSTTLSLGVELELQVLDNTTLLLVPRAQEILDRVGNKQFKKEFFQSTIEIVSSVCQNVHAVETEIKHLLQQALATSKTLGLRLSSTGTHPEADYRDRFITPSDRYYELADRNQWLIRRMAVYGMHIHIGMPSADRCIQFNNFLLHIVPHVLALSASSPFWQRMYTGLAAARPTVYESMPTCGIPYVVKNWRQFENLYNTLVRSQSIKGMSDLWWDIRPSPGFGTLELRICDEPATFQEMLCIVAFVHTLAHWYADYGEEWRTNNKTIHRWILRENKWRAIRYGLEAEIIVKGEKNPIRISDHIFEWMDKLQPYYKMLGYEIYKEYVYNVIKYGNSAHRQLQVFRDTENLHKVVETNVAEFEKSIM